MEQMTLSIITPSFNQSKFITKNIKSILSQNRNDVEHIIIDGGSDDGTVDIIKDYENMYNLRWISEPDRGQTHALNKGLKLANGKWIGWQNSDDYYLPGSFEKFLATLERNPRADGIYGDLLIVDEDGTQISRKFMTSPSKFVQRYWSIFASNQALFVRKPVLERIFPLDESLRYTMDAELTWKLLEGNYQLVHVPEPLGAFRIQHDAKTFQDVSSLQNDELRKIYGVPWYDDYFPKFLLQNIAKFTKFAFLVSDFNVKALKYNVNKRISQF